MKRILIVGLLIAGGCSSTATGSDDDGGDCEVVTYLIEASAPRIGFDITLSNQSGDTEQTTGMGSWDARYSCFPGDEFAYVSAQMSNGDGSIRCEIRRNGTVVAEAKSSGEFVIASCSD